MFRERPQTGFSVIAAIFILVVLAVLAVIIASVTGIQQASSQLDVLGVRAYHAARAGMEWGAHRVLDPNNQLNLANCDGGVVGGPPSMSVCPASPTHLAGLGESLAGFAVTVTCAQAADTTEGNRNVRVFTVVATACQPHAGSCPGTVTSADYVERQLQASFAKCWDRTATAPRCECG